MKPFYHTTHRLALRSRILFLCLLASLAALPAFAQTTWTGASNTDWNTASNWSTAAVPTATSVVIIPNVTNKPILGAGTSAVALSVKVDVGASLTILATGSLTINGSEAIGLSNIGTVVNSGSVIIGNTVGPYRGLINYGTFNNAGGTITIDRTIEFGFLITQGGIFTNAGGSPSARRQRWEIMAL